MSAHRSLPALLAVVMLSCRPGASAPPYLILHDFFVGPKPEPEFLRSHKAYLESLPFDGIAVYMRDSQWKLNVTASVMTNTPLTQEAIASVLSPISGLTFSNLTNNFGLLYAHRPADFFEDWTTPVNNFRNLARALKNAGLKGIFFDDEQYETWATYPEGATYSSTVSLAQYQNQARLRGKQVMEAMVSEFPDIIIIVLVGPWASDQTFYELHLDYNNISHANKLIGPFFVGLVEGKGPTAAVVDGGEFYAARTAAEFNDLYNYQKYGITGPNGVPRDQYSRAAGPAGFIPQGLLPLWPTMVEVSTGLYDQPIPGRADMRPDIMRTTIVNALARVDRYVWLYVEGITFLEPPGTSKYSATSEWLNAVRQGKDEGTARLSRGKP